MDFIDEICGQSARNPEMLKNIHTEEATKAALVVPFIEALGYSVSDPTDVTPQFVADTLAKKGEKVDYVLKVDGKSAILVECKFYRTDLKNSSLHTQLSRYFSCVHEAKFGILTNGIQYMFYTDLVELNEMDEKPFFEFDMGNVNEPAVMELEKFSKSLFNLPSLLATRVELKHKKETKDLLCNQLDDPDEKLVRFVASKILKISGSNDSRKHLTAPLKEKFTAYTKWALNEVIKEKAQSLNTAASSLVSTSGGKSDPVIKIVSPANQADESYYIIRTILREVVPPKNVTIREAKNCFKILLDNNQQKPICHLHFNDPQKYVTFFDSQTPERVLIQDPDDLCKYSDRLKASVARYDPKTAAQNPNG